jgi:DNA polymerase III delta subunit
VKPIVAVIGPREAGPGERQEMLDRAHGILADAGIDEPTRIDVPGRGAGTEAEYSELRHEVEPLIPALQSGSLFGGRSGILVMDAHQLLKAEATVLAELIAAVDPDQSVVVFVATGSIPAPLGASINAEGETIRVRKLRERDAGEWLSHAARERRVTLHADAAKALVQRFGSDVAAMAQALDQLAASGADITPEAVRSRFANRPDEPMWHYADAIAAGDSGGALRRLSDFLTHGHPLQLLAFAGGEVRRRALAAAAPDVATYAEWVGAKPDAYPVKKAWARRSDSTDEQLRSAVRAIARADLALKTAPEATHRVTLERLTVALCLWMGGRGR